MMVQTSLLALLSWSAIVVASSGVNQTTGQELSSLLSVTSTEETRRVRRLEAEMETLRRMVTDLKSAGPCTAQQSSLEADDLSVAQEVRGLRHHVQSLRMHSELSAIRSELQSLRSRLPSDVSEELKVPAVSANVTHPSPLLGSVYIRWGNGQCPPEADLVYSGVIGGSHYTHDGAAANALCLPLNPFYEDYGLPTYVAYVYGAEYEVTPQPSHDLDSKCSVCHVTRASIMMVPATNSCHTGWTLEYSGILMAGHHTHKAATEFVCMDSALEGVTDTKADKNGNVFYFAVSVCGSSLPCPPYINNKVLSCAVCSK